MNNTLPQIHAMQTQIADLEEQQRRRGGWTVQDDGLVVPSQASGYPGSRPATQINHCRYSEFVDEPIGGDVCPAYGPLTPAVAGFVAAIQMGLPGMYVLRLLGDAQTFLLPALSVLLDQHVQIILGPRHQRVPPRQHGPAVLVAASPTTVGGSRNEPCMECESYYVRV